MEDKGKEIKVIDRRTPFEKETNGKSQQDVLALAIQKNYAPEFIEKMMELQEKHERREAEKAFYKAKADFKKEAPAVKKDKYNKFFESWYTSLGNLLDTYNPFLGKHGLSISYKPETTESNMTLTGVLSHRMGHSESISFAAPIDKAAVGKQSGQRSRNAIQDVKSTFTYLRSAVTEALLGVAGTEASSIDDDGNAAGNIEYINEKQLSTIVDMINAKEVNQTTFCKWLKAEAPEYILSKDYNKAIAALKAKK